MLGDWRHVLAVTMMVVVAVTAPSNAVKYKGMVLCNWLVKLENFFLCHNAKVSLSLVRQE